MHACVHVSKCACTHFALLLAVLLNIVLKPIYFIFLDSDPNVGICTIINFFFFFFFLGACVCASRRAARGLAAIVAAS